MPPEPPAEQAVAIDHRVDGSRGRQQVTTLPSSSSVEPPLTTPSVAILSAHHARHDSQSTGCMECCAKRPAFRSMHPWKQVAEPHTPPQSPDSTLRTNYASHDQQLTKYCCDSMTVCNRSRACKKGMLLERRPTSATANIAATVELVRRCSAQRLWLKRPEPQR